MKTKEIIVIASVIIFLLMLIFIWVYQILHPDFTELRVLINTWPCYLVIIATGILIVTYGKTKD